MAKRDDRSNNVERIRDIIHNTEENLKEANESMEFGTDFEQRQQIKRKNERRKDSIQALKEELRDEIEARKK